MIHRLSAEDGSDLGHFDHGVTGRASFVDAATGASSSLPQVPFDPNSAAKIKDCPGGDFTKSPECWNIADFRRRVWGIGVRHDAKGAVRLYYAVWGGQRSAIRNTLVLATIGTQLRVVGRYHRDGDFDPSSVRREFFLPDFSPIPPTSTGPAIAIPAPTSPSRMRSTQNVMLVSERGGVRNLGLKAVEPFAHPHESRVLRYELDRGAFGGRSAATMSASTTARKHAPYVLANARVARTSAMVRRWRIDRYVDARPIRVDDGQFALLSNRPVHRSGHRALRGRLPGSRRSGTRLRLRRPPGWWRRWRSFRPGAPPYPSIGTSQSCMIDTDINVDANGAAFTSP